MKTKQLFMKLKKSSAFSSLLVFVFLMVINAILQPRFFTPLVIKSNIMTFTPLILLAIAQAIIVISGGIDMSIGTSVTLINVIIASLMKDTTGSIFLALLVGFAAALVMGAVNGICVGYIKMPPMVATFATSAIWYGISLLIMPQPGGYIPADYYRLYQQSLLDIIPVSLIVIIVAVLIWNLVKTRRTYRNLYATGGNESAASANGINTARTKLTAYLIASVFISLAAFSVTAQTASGDAHVGDSFALTSIASIVIGGISLAGGRGTIFGAILGAISLSLLINVIFFANIPSLYQEFIKGLIIIISLVVSIIPNLKKVNHQTIVKQ
jgi:ribose transport system permease protein